MWSVAKRSCVSWLFSLPCSQETGCQSLPSCGSVKCLPILTNGRQELLLVTPNVQQSTRETPWHAIDTFPSVTLEARRRGKRVTISFSYLTLDFIILTQIQLLGRSGRGRKATRSRRRVCALHSCTENHEETVMTSSSYHANIRVTSTNVPARPAPNGRKELARYSFDLVSRGIYFKPLNVGKSCSTWFMALGLWSRVW